MMTATELLDLTFAALADPTRRAILRAVADGGPVTATALAGDLESASRLADQAIAAGEGADRSEAAYVAAVALAHRGQLARSAELFRWAPPGPDRDVHARVRR